MIELMDEGREIVAGFSDREGFWQGCLQMAILIAILL
jgi:hypothetical protein